MRGFYDWGPKSQGFEDISLAGTHPPIAKKVSSNLKIINSQITILASNHDQIIASFLIMNFCNFFPLLQKSSTDAVKKVLAGEKPGKESRLV